MNWIKPLALTGTVLLTLWIVSVSIFSDRDEVKVVVVEGNRYYSDSLLIDFVLSKMEIMSMDKQTQKRLESLLTETFFLEAVGINHEKQGRLVVTVSEREPIAWMKSKQKMMMIDSAGFVFNNYPDGFFDLPVIDANGSIHSVKKVVASLSTMKQSSNPGYALISTLRIENDSTAAITILNEPTRYMLNIENMNNEFQVAKAWWKQVKLTGLSTATSVDVRHPEIIVTRN